MKTEISNSDFFADGPTGKTHDLNAGIFFGESGFGVYDNLVKEGKVVKAMVVEQIAEKYNLLLIDMSDLSPANRLDLHAGVSNPHFGIAGNVFIANRIVEELAKYFEENPLRCELTYWQRKN